MTRTDVIKYWELIKEFKEGKEIQYSLDGEKWKTHNSIDFCDTFLYRIKPEPELIPFDYLDAEFLIGRAVIDKMSQVIWLITAIDLKYVLLSKQKYTYEELLDKFRFLDGTPCGNPSQP